MAPVPQIATLLLAAPSHQQHHHRDQILHHLRSKPLTKALLNHLIHMHHRKHPNNQGPMHMALRQLLIHLNKPVLLHYPPHHSNSPQDHHLSVVRHSRHLRDPARQILAKHLLLQQSGSIVSFSKTLLSQTITLLT